MPFLTRGFAPAMAALAVMCVTTGLATSTPAGPANIPGLSVYDDGGRLMLKNPVIIKHWSDPHSAASTGTVSTKTSPTATHQTRAGEPWTLKNTTPITGSGDITAKMAPGGAVVFKIDATAGTVELSSVNRAGFLTEKANQAVTNTPPWLQIRLAANLADLTPAVQDTLVEPLLDESLADWWDEIAFLLGSITPGNLALEGFDVRSIVDQVRFAQMADESLDYVELRNYTDATKGQYTTAAYTWVQDALEKTFELDPEDYYWWVLHPILDMEMFIDANPTTGQADTYPAGLSWREYYLHNRPWPGDDGGPASYIPHFIFKKAAANEGVADYPAIDPDSLRDWEPVQRGFIQEINVGAQWLTMDSLIRPTTIEFKVRRTGIVLATTLEVERAWAEGKSDLLENMVRYGPGNVGLNRYNGRILVIKEREPVASQAGVIEAVLDEFKYKYDVVDSAWLADGDLSAYSKILVPSDQTLAVYQAMSIHADKIEEWLRGKWRILEIHGAVTDPERDWSGYMMPGGFSAAEVTYFAAPGDDYATVLGQPFLNPGAVGNPDNPKTIDILWDDSIRDIRGGDRFVSVTKCAIDRFTWWAGQNMPDSVTDWAEKHYGAQIDRTSQANRVLYQHFGNCGELQDIQTAALRTMLIPTSNTSNSAEDHVWSEFLVDGTWYSSGLDWSDGYVNIANFNVSNSKKFGGIKNISFVTQSRGDGAMINRTATYADTGFLTVKVRDAVGVPIAGALVMVATEAWNLDGDSYPLTLAYWDVTGSDGNVVIETGANVQENLETDCLDLNNRCNNYYVKVITNVGNFPGESGSLALAVAAAEAGVGYSKEVTATVAGTAVPTEPAGTADMWSPVADTAVNLSIANANRLRCGDLGDGFSWCDQIEDQTAAPEGRLMALNQENMDKWLVGDEFQASYSQPIKTDGSSLPQFTAGGWPTGGTWYLLITHGGALQDRLLISGNLNFVAGQAVVEQVEFADEPGMGDVVEQRDEAGTDSSVGTDTTVTADDGTEDTGTGGSSGGCQALDGPAGTGNHTSQAGTLLIMILLTAALTLRRTASRKN